MQTNGVAVGVAVAVEGVPVAVGSGVAVAHGSVVATMAVGIGVGVAGPGDAAGIGRVAPLEVMLADIAHLDLEAGRVGGCVGEDAPLEGLHEHPG